MQVKFTINYKTLIGQVLKIVGNIPQLGNNDVEKAPQMFPVDGINGDWDFSIDLPEAKIKSFKYKYIVEDLNHKARFFEWGNERSLNLSKLTLEKILIQDTWKDAHDVENTFHSSAFSEILFNRPKSKNNRSKEISNSTLNLLFNLSNFRVDKNHCIAITGSIKELGEWDTSNVLFLDEIDFPIWTTQVAIKKTSKPIFYKYCIIDKKSKKIITIESEERKISYKSTPDAVILNDQNFVYPTGNWKGSGVAIPVFSLRSKNGHGVGEFLDIKLLVDWALKTGMKLIQILPINDTVATHTWQDSYPYAAISVFALHPIYLNLKAIGNLSSKITQEIIDVQKTLLNELEKVDYDAVMKIKSRFYKQIYDEQRDDFLKSTEFKKFFKENSEWLVPYAAFSYLRDLFGTPDFSKWGRFSKISQQTLNELTDPNSSHFDDIAVHYFIQYHLHIQLLDAANYARKKGIVLKGDIPIGIFRHSVDAWMEPHLYNMHSQAGAPPDDFSEEGQNWRFPTYNWAEMQKDGYKWWQNRMKKMSNYFDAFRIDHILGFFRIWEIPETQIQGLLGYFNPSIPIYKNEFYEKCINFDFFRFCTPYIREHMLGQIFGDLAGEIKTHFLESSEYGKYYLKEDFNTQQKIEKHIDISESDSPEERAKKQFIRNGLFRLVTEVLFLPYPHSDQETFVPRHSLYKTYSYNELGHEDQRKVMELYNDYYFNRNEEYWKNEALVKLPAVKEATNMLICGEDLGMIPKCVPSVMNDLGILSLEIQRMPKDSNIEFTHPNDFPYLSVATPSSHDTSTIRGWWEEDSSRSQRFYNNILGKWGNSPYFCEPWLVKDIINQHIFSPSMWVIFPIQDLLGMDENLRFLWAKEERINNPANPKHYWRYRLHINLEDLIKEDEFNNMLKNMLEESGRVSNY
ncbi:MAG: 4-alpha-glucanotransferase [Bacteroidales bacterium]|nr:4-alpha-glucanotransferase [Bacteroidales bacterium]